MFVESFLLGQVALDEHLPAPVAIQAVEHVLHLLARGKQHQRPARAFDQFRQVTDDRRRVGTGITRIGLEIRHPQHTGIGMVERAGDHGRHRGFRPARMRKRSKVPRAVRVAEVTRTP